MLRRILAVVAFLMLPVAVSAHGLDMELKVADRTVTVTLTWALDQQHWKPPPPAPVESLPSTRRMYSPGALKVAFPIGEKRKPGAAPKQITEFIERAAKVLRVEIVQQGLRGERGCVERLALRDKRDHLLDRVAAANQRLDLALLERTHHSDR